MKENEKMLYKVNCKAINHPLIVFSFMSISLGILLCMMNNASDGTYSHRDKILFVNCLSAGYLGWLLICVGRSIYFTTEGIVFKFLFWNYKMLPWDLVDQIGIYHKMLVITPYDVPKYSRTEKSIKNYVKENQLHLIVIDATKENLDAIDWFYGFVDYRA